MAPGFEDMFRFLWRKQFGQSVESSFGLTKMPQCDLSTSHFQMDLVTLLRDFKEHIRNEGLRANIDARAIAGAIAWEYKNNKTGRYTDHLQFTGTDQANRYSFGSGDLMFGQGLGWGSVHTDAARAHRPHANDWELQCLRMKADTAITLVADIMKANAESYHKLSEGVWIGDQPSVGALFFNTGDGLLIKSAARVKNDPTRDSGTVTLTITQNPMAAWVEEHLSDFEDFRTASRPPGTAKIKVRVK